MPPPPPSSKKVENLRAETKKLEDIAKKKVQSIDKAEKAEAEHTKQEIQQINSELEKFKKKTDDVLSGNAEGTGWDEQAVNISERMKQLIEQEARLKHSLLLKTDEATTELELKAKPIRKELPLVSDFSEEDRVQMLNGIDKSINKLKQKREMIEMMESKLNRQMQVLMESTPDPTEDRQTIMRKLQMSFDVVSGANDPDRARDDLLKQLCASSKQLVGSRANGIAPKKSHSPAPQKPNKSCSPSMGSVGSADRLAPRSSNPATPSNLQGRMSRPSNPDAPLSTLQANSTNSKSPSPTLRTTGPNNIPPSSSTRTTPGRTPSPTQPHTTPIKHQPLNVPKPKP